jgi:CRISPR-associated Cas5-like protein
VFGPPLQSPSVAVSWIVPLPSTIVGLACVLTGGVRFCGVIVVVSSSQTLPSIGSSAHA